MAVHLDSKRPTPIIASQMEFKEPLTQSPMTAETPVVIRDDAQANPQLPDEEKIVALYGHICEECGAVFDCNGDENGNHAVDLCVCEQMIAAYPKPHLIYYCSYECSLVDTESETDVE